MKRQDTEADILMWQHLRELGGGQTSKEYKFFPKRKWRADFLLEWNIRLKILIEIEGGACSRGRHTRGAGFIGDMDKYNHAALLGYKVLRFTPAQVLDGSAISFIKRVLES